MRILMIEDDPDTGGYLDSGLHGEGHELHRAVDGRAGLLRAVGEDWDLLIVDRRLPKLDGLALVRTLRSGGVTAPVLFLTTLEGIDDRARSAGADGCLSKPFALAELVAQVDALGQKTPRAASDTILRVADLEMDMTRRTVCRAERRIHLQPREFRVLECLMRHAGQVVTRTMLIESVWESGPRTNVVDSHVSRLRGKIDRGLPELIHTVRGTGYCLRAPS